MSVLTSYRVRCPASRCLSIALALRGLLRITPGSSPAVYPSTPTHHRHTNTYFLACTALHSTARDDLCHFSCQITIMLCKTYYRTSSSLSHMSSCLLGLGNVRSSTRSAYKLAVNLILAHRRGSQVSPRESFRNHKLKSPRFGACWLENISL